VAFRAATLAAMLGAASRAKPQRRGDRHHPVEHRGWHSPGADPAGQRRPGADPVNEGGCTSALLVEVGDGVGSSELASACSVSGCFGSPYLWVAIAVVLLMAPAAYHRIVYAGEVSEDRTGSVVRW
jgi:hypothetical protein